MADEVETTQTAQLGCSTETENCAWAQAPVYDFQ